MLDTCTGHDWVAIYIYIYCCAIRSHNNVVCCSDGHHIGSRVEGTRGGVGGGDAQCIGSFSFLAFVCLSGMRHSTTLRTGHHNALHAEALNRAGYARCHVFCVWRWSHFAARVKRWCSRVYGPQTRNRLRTRRLQCRWRQCCCKTLRREPWKGSRSEADHGNSKDCTKLQCHRHQPKRPCLGLFYPQSIVPASRNIRTATHHVHSFP